MGEARRGWAIIPGDALGTMISRLVQQRNPAHRPYGGGNVIPNEVREVKITGISLFIVHCQLYILAASPLQGLAAVRAELVCGADRFAAVGAEVFGLPLRFARADGTSAFADALHEKVDGS